MKNRRIFTEYYDFFERVINIYQGGLFLSHLFFIGHLVCRLDVVSLTAFITHKIHFKILSVALAVIKSCLFGYDTYIHTKPSCN